MSDLLQTDFFSAQYEQEVMSLRDLSARVGSDPLLVQASNGNTSIKLDGVLWIKASGKWLARATEDDIFVPVELADVQESIGSGAEVPFRQYIKDTKLPSIETPMHAVLRHRVVIHVHSINAIAWAIRVDGPDQLRERLAGLKWRWIPYTPSGIPLARKIEQTVADTPETDILILGNHGLVVCGSDCQSAEKLLAEVERRIAIAPRRPPEPDAAVLEMIARISGWQFPEVETLHALGTDSVTRKILSGGVLYPCQAIFLGRTMPLFPPAMSFSNFAENFCGAEKALPFIAVEKGGVMLNEKMNDAERATLIALAEVAQRTSESARLRYLEDSEVEDVLSGGAESYKEMVDVPARKS